MTKIVSLAVLACSVLAMSLTACVREAPPIEREATNVERTPARPAGGPRLETYSVTTQGMVNNTAKRAKIQAFCDDGDVAIGGGCEGPGLDLEGSRPGWPILVPGDDGLERTGNFLAWDCTFRPGERDTVATTTAICLVGGAE